MFVFFFFNDTATTEIYTLSLHDALPIYVYQGRKGRCRGRVPRAAGPLTPMQACSAGSRSGRRRARVTDRKSTRLNSSHQIISYAVFCLKKKKNTKRRSTKESDRDKLQKT